jgi:hypothetical protein
MIDSISERSAEIAFGRFRVLPAPARSAPEGQPVKLDGRAFDGLMALIEAIVGKDG